MVGTNTLAYFVSPLARDKKVLKDWHLGNPPGGNFSTVSTALIAPLADGKVKNYFVTDT